MVNRTQGERLVAMETKMDVIQKDIKEIKDFLKTHVEWEETKYKEMREQYAAKWIEKAFYAIALAIIGLALQIIFFGG